MGGASSYYAMLSICGFLSAAWMASKVSRLVGVSSIVLEIGTGVIFGPQLVGLIKDEYATCEHARHSQCMPPPNVKQLALNGHSIGDHLQHFNNHDDCNVCLFAAEAESGHHCAHSGHGGHGGNHGLSASENGQLDNHTSDGSSAGGGHEDHASGGGHDGGHSTADMDHHAGSHGAPHGSHSAQHTMAQGHDDGRRLSGSGDGGAKFHSFEECLEKTCEAHVAHECGLTPDVFTLIGHAGVALMIFESGMHFDFEKAKVVGAKACCVAVLGTILPLIAGTLIMLFFGKDPMPQGISAGTALAPTSVGISLRLLGEAGVLQHDFGQAIITAAFVDDILSLVLFNVLFSLGGGFDLFKVVIAPIIGISFMLVAMYGAVNFWPKVIDGMIMPLAPGRRDDTLTGWRRIRLEKDELLFLGQIVLLVAYSLITHLLGTHLWGCFIAGMSFACLSPPHHAHHVWVKQTKRMTSWMVRIFFSCTVAFSIPVLKLLSFDAFWKGSILGVFACILTKVFCAPFMGPPRWVIGWAMVGRAEFAYLIAQMALAGNMLDEQSFSIVIWALLYATIFAPFAFRVLLNRYIREQGIEIDPKAIGEHNEEAHEDEAHGHVEGTGLKADFAGAEGIHPNDIDIECEKGAIKRGLDAEESPRSAPTPSTMAARGRGATGRAADGKQGPGNGFLCCLFFKRITVQ